MLRAFLCAAPLANQWRRLIWINASLSL